MCISMYQINYGIIRMDVSTLLTLIGIELAMITLEYTWLSYISRYGLGIQNHLEIIIIICFDWPINENSISNF